MTGQAGGRQWQYQHSTAHEGMDHLKDGILVGPIKHVINALIRKRLKREAGCRRSTVAGGQRPQAKFYRAGLA